jgi:enamine deaminase RidA (YjgF/YER057c/UK114 family)
MSALRFGIGPRMSQGVFWNGLLISSAQVAKDFELDATGQTSQVLDKIDALLTEAGLRRDQILSCNIWLADMEDYAALNAIWDAWISKENPPSRVCVETKFSSPKIKVEVQVIAAA